MLLLTRLMSHVYCIIGTISDAHKSLCKAISSASLTDNIHSFKILRRRCQKSAAQKVFSIRGSQTITFIIIINNINMAVSDVIRLEFTVGITKVFTGVI